jgi:SAM-dependent methyltransferase
MTEALPLPPEELAFRVIGTRDLEAFAMSGEMHVSDLDAALRTTGATVTDATHLLDWGCGCGRLLRRFREVLPNAEVVGADTDAEAIAWLDAHLPGVRAVHIDPLPPLPFGDASFDLIVGFSVFTHLDETYQDAWLSELRRVTRPGGQLLLTVHGPGMVEQHAVNFAGNERFDVVHAVYQATGFAYWSDDGTWDDHFPDYYRTSYHRPDYIRTHWDQWFEVLNVVPGTPSLPHDVAVLRVPA